MVDKASDNIHSVDKLSHGNLGVLGIVLKINILTQTNLVALANATVKTSTAARLLGTLLKNYQALHHALAEHQYNKGRGDVLVSWSNKNAILFEFIGKVFEYTTDQYVSKISNPYRYELPTYNQDFNLGRHFIKAGASMTSFSAIQLVRNLYDDSYEPIALHPEDIDALIKFSVPHKVRMEVIRLFQEVMTTNLASRALISLQILFYLQTDAKGLRDRIKDSARNPAFVTNVSAIVHRILNMAEIQYDKYSHSKKFGLIWVLSDYQKPPAERPFALLSGKDANSRLAEALKKYNDGMDEEEEEEEEEEEKTERLESGDEEEEVETLKMMIADRDAIIAKKDATIERYKETIADFEEGLGGGPPPLEPAQENTTQEELRTLKQRLEASAAENKGLNQLLDQFKGTFKKDRETIEGLKAQIDQLREQSTQEVANSEREEALELASLRKEIQKLRANESDVEVRLRESRAEVRNLRENNAKLVSQLEDARTDQSSRIASLNQELHKLQVEHEKLILKDAKQVQKISEQERDIRDFDAKVKQLKSQLEGSTEQLRRLRQQEASPPPPTTTTVITRPVTPEPSPPPPQVNPFSSLFSDAGDIKLPVVLTLPLRAIQEQFIKLGLISSELTSTTSAIETFPDKIRKLITEVIDDKFAYLRKDANMIRNKLNEEKIGGGLLITNVGPPTPLTSRNGVKVDAQKVLVDFLVLAASFALYLMAYIKDKTLAAVPMEFVQSGDYRLYRDKLFERYGDTFQKNPIIRERAADRVILAVHRRTQQKADSIGIGTVLGLLVNKPESLDDDTRASRMNTAERLYNELPPQIMANLRALSEPEKTKNAGLLVQKLVIFSIANGYGRNAKGTTSGELSVMNKLDPFLFFYPFNLGATFNAQEQFQTQEQQQISFQEPAKSLSFQEPAQRHAHSDIPGSRNVFQQLDDLSELIENSNASNSGAISESLELILRYYTDFYENLPQHDRHRAESFQKSVYLRLQQLHETYKHKQPHEYNVHSLFDQVLRFYYIK